MVRSGGACREDQFVKRIRLSRAALGAGFVTGAATVAALTLAVGVFGAVTPSAVRWNHTGATAGPGVQAQVQAASKIPPGLVWQTINVIEQYGTKVGVVDVGPGGDSVGDYVVFRDKLRNPNTNAVVGTIDAQCMSGFADMCRGVIHLNGRGQITFDGETEIGVDPDRYAVVGGTGKFVDVGGQMQVAFPSNDYAALTITLTH
jgi:hypothetical protein